jgi:hypothetical protein
VLKGHDFSRQLQSSKKTRHLGLEGKLFAFSSTLNLPVPDLYRQTVFPALLYIPNLESLLVASQSQSIAIRIGNSAVHSQTVEKRPAIQQLRFVRTILRLQSAVPGGRRRRLLFGAGDLHILLRQN